MKLSKREQTIALVTIVAVLLGLGYWYIFIPYQDARTALRKDNAETMMEVTKARHLFDDQKAAIRKWKQMTDLGLGTDASAADSTILHSILDFAQNAGLNLSIKPDRVDQEKQFKKISYRATGNGSLAAITNFLWQVRNSPSPARVTDLTITNRKEGSDELTLTVDISTLVLVADAKDAAPSTPAAADKELQ